MRRSVHAKAARAVWWGLALACMGLLPVAAYGQGCVGDCRGDGKVSIDDLITGVNIALGTQSVSTCTAMDPSGDGTVGIDELIRAVTAALDGCPATPTATATAISADTATATATSIDTATVVPSPTPSQTPPATSPTPTSIPTAPVYFCDLPGSVQSTAPGNAVVSGGASTPDVSFVSLPHGFCAHFFATVGDTRQLRFAPGGELFVASPTTGTTGGNAGAGKAAIIALADDDGDGVAEVQTTFLSGIPSTQGLLFTGGYLYYQDGTKIMRVPYRAGDRTASASSEQVANVTIHFDPVHWPKALDVDDNGTIYVANGGGQNDICTPNYPFLGGILKLDGSPGGTPVAKGFRNPISIRCLRGRNLCFAVELAKDFTATEGGREKIVPIRQGDDWGFPCCASKDLPYGDVHPKPDCSMVAAEINSFIIGDTPFDVDFVTDKWPDPWNNRAYVPLHGVAGSWTGARVVAISIDKMTGDLLPGSDLPGASPGTMVDFATGWDDGRRSHGRPAEVAVARDGRLFLGNDNTGDIIWIAPMSLPLPTPVPTTAPTG